MDFIAPETVLLTNDFASGDGSGGFRTSAGALFDPSEVILTIELNGDPSSAVTYVYGAAGSPIVRLSLGLYQAAIGSLVPFPTAPRPQFWRALWAGTGSIIAVQDPATRLVIRDPEVPLHF